MGLTIVFSASAKNLKIKVKNKNNRALANVILLQNYKELSQSDNNGIIVLNEKDFDFSKSAILFLENYELLTIKLDSKSLGEINEFILSSLHYKITESVIRNRKASIRDYRILRDVEGTTINAGRKNEVVMLSDMLINKASNNARQIFSKVVGLTVNESSEGGLQLNVGARGLNPNRTANFNTRQNGYDISADVLGYPESYYTPTAEAISEIRVVRGASALQYGTQFGGMINFKMKSPHSDKIYMNHKLSYGSYNFVNLFSDFSGTLNKFSYYTFFDYKRGDGYRPNSKYSSYNGFVNLNYAFTSKSKLSLDWLKYYYVAQQAGGLTDYMFYTDPRQSIRPRNYFKVDWNILNIKYLHRFNNDLRFSLSLFGLIASRSALGFRTNRVSQEDDMKSPRDLLVGKFNNWGSELKFIYSYNIKNNRNNLLVGFKYYQSINSSQQGAGSSSTGKDFNFATKEFPLYERQSKFRYPNLNFALFSENIFRIGKRTTITPGIRLEYIRTQSRGSYRVIAQHAGRILNDTTIKDNVIKPRFIVISGLSVSHKFRQYEFYGNISQNYRSVTFSDIHSYIPGFTISPTISDEKGFSFDIGMRSSITPWIYVDCSTYLLYYGNKIGEYYHVNSKTGAVERYRDNVGTALTYGFESLVNWNINRTFWNLEDLIFSTYLNSSVTGSKYLKSDVPNIKGNQVEFVPLLNLKTGIEVGYKNFLFNTQLTLVTSQFAEATNQKVPAKDNQYGIFGQIPTYYVWDIAMSYRVHKYVKLEANLQNITNNHYFTQRATGYPGPGIIPSQPFNFIVGLHFNW